jgi:hypothetical protein
VGPHHRIKGSGELIASFSPLTNQLQPQNRCPAKLDCIEILVGDGISPVNQLLKPILPRLIAKIQVSYLIPKRKPKSIVVGPNVAWIGVSYLQFTALDQDVTKGRSQEAMWNALDKVVRRL